MGLLTSDKIRLWLGVSNIILALAVFLYTFLTNRKKGPKISIYGVKSIHQINKTDETYFFVKCEFYVQNYGDMPGDVVIKPLLKLHDEKNEALDQHDSSREIINIAAGESIHFDWSFAFKSEPIDWLTGEIKFNAYYYNKKRKLVYLKTEHDSFLIEKPPVI